MTDSPNTPEPELLRLGLLARSRKPDERRLPIHPTHIASIDEDLRGRLILERGYGEPFGVSDAQLEPLVGLVASREELIALSDVVVLPKPQHSDLEDLR